MRVPGQGKKLNGNNEQKESVAKKMVAGHPLISWFEARYHGISMNMCYLQYDSASLVHCALLQLIIVSKSFKVQIVPVVLTFASNAQRSFFCAGLVKPPKLKCG